MSLTPWVGDPIQPDEERRVCVMGVVAWGFLIGEVVLVIWVMRFIGRVEKERPTASIVPATAADIELVE